MQFNEYLEKPDLILDEKMYYGKGDHIDIAISYNLCKSSIKKKKIYIECNDVSPHTARTWNIKVSSSFAKNGIKITLKVNTTEDDVVIIDGGGAEDFKLILKEQVDVVYMNNIQQLDILKVKAKQFHLGCIDIVSFLHDKELVHIQNLYMMNTYINDFSNDDVEMIQIDNLYNQYSTYDMYSSIVGTYYNTTLHYDDDDNRYKVAKIGNYYIDTNNVVHVRQSWADSNSDLKACLDNYTAFLI